MQSVIPLWSRHPKTSILANSEDPDEMLHFIRCCTVWSDKIDRQRNKYNIILETITCDPSIYTMDYLGLIVCSFMKKIIGLRRVNEMSACFNLILYVPSTIFQI